MTLDFIFKTCTGHDTAYWAERGELDWYSTYANVQRDAGKGILVANWNEFPRKGDNKFNWSNKGRKFQSILESLGYQLEWSDQTSRCEECNGAIDREPYTVWDGPHSAIIGECSEICKWCIQNDPTEYLEGLAEESYADHKELDLDGIDPEDYDYKVVELKTTDKGSEIAKVFKRLDNEGYEGLIFQRQKYNELKAWAKKVPTSWVSTTFGELPSEDDFREHFENELDGDNYRITLSTSDSEALEDTEFGDGSYSCDQLYRACKDVIERQSELPEGAMDFVSAIMDTLKFEWI